MYILCMYMYIYIYMCIYDNRYLIYTIVYIYIHTYVYIYIYVFCEMLGVCDFGWMMLVSLGWRIDSCVLLGFHGFQIFVGNIFDDARNELTLRY